MFKHRRVVISLLAGLVCACGPEAVQPDTSDVPAAPMSAPALTTTSRTFVEPTGGEHFAEPAGVGTLRICRSPDNSIRDAVHISSGTQFMDSGVIDQPPEQGGGWWLLWVQTTQTVSLAAGQDCVTAEARVVPSEVPANYADLRPLTQFNVSDRRYFEIMSDGENLDRYPALLLMNATAHTDFR